MICIGCGAPIVRKPGTSPAHWRRRRYCTGECQRRHLKPTGRPRIEFATRFWESVKKTDTCWLWSASLNTYGYGKAYTGGSDGLRLGAHIAAWQFATGEPVPDGLFVCHTCDCRACVRNDDMGVYIVADLEYPRRGHLWLGTLEANQADMVAKGRSLFGVRHPKARLTEDQVRLVLACPEIPATHFARSLGVSFGTIDAIRQGRNWRHIVRVV